ncbi:MAG TPA: hypothetical protein VKQ36_13430 [Ktedonobacterales bacterium]|nr:hypothetical protein [Ktedonobacterales bacterium]
MCATTSQASDLPYIPRTAGSPLGRRQHRQRRQSASAQTERPDISRVELATPLPCGVCQRSDRATLAFVEPDARQPGLWTILPLCDECHARLQTC